MFRRTHRRTSPAGYSKLWKAFENLKKQGNTVVVIEHDESLIARCDHCLTIGPTAGEKGGQVISMGKPSGMPAVEIRQTSLALKAPAICSIK